MASEHGGYALLWRKFLEHPYWTEKRTFSRAEAWLDCWFGMAAHSDHRKMVGGQVVSVKRGQFVASDRFLERRWRWSRSKVRRFISAAIDNGELLRDGQVNGACSPDDTAGGTVYRIANYDTYQPCDTTDDTAHDTGAGPRTSQREVREVREVREETDTLFDSPAVEKKKSKRGTQLPADWKPSDAHVALANELGVGLRTEADSFRDHAAANGRVQKDWNAAFNNWLRNAKKFGRQAPQGSPAAAVRNERPQSHDTRQGRMTSTDGRDPDAEKRERERREHEEVVQWEREHPADVMAIREEVARSMGAETWADIDVFNRLLATGKVKARIRSIIDSEQAA